ncbi:MAG: O-antigen ligase family protein [Candidatus Hydrogenedentes bacterium]|nr:O-antigen ligase family protein [Candidatus Hydrogenedentota bacterium]
MSAKAARKPASRAKGKATTPHLEPATHVKSGEHTVKRFAQEPIAYILAVLVLFRPWRDGITFPTDNVYYLWGIQVAFILWALLLLFRGGAIRHTRLALLLGLFLVVAVLTAANSIQADATYRALLFWSGHFCLFVVAANALRTRTAIGIVLSAFVATAFAEAVFSVIHLNYILPLTRQQLALDPSLAERYFGSSTLNAELEHRLLVNRAFGSFLFPNALAAFMLVSIPYVIGQAWISVRQYLAGLTAARERVSAAPSPSPRQSFLVLLITPVTFTILMVAGFAAFGFTAYARDVLASPNPQLALQVGLQAILRSHWLGSAVFAVVLPLAVSSYLFSVGVRHGLRMYWLTVRAYFLPVVVCMNAVALMMTYSRGGMLALCAALLFAGGLLWWTARTLRAKNARSIKPVAVVATMLVVLSLSLSIGAASSPAPSNEQPLVASPTTGSDGAAYQPPASTPPKVNLRGIDVTLQDVLNPATMLLRLGYWRTGFLMAKDNFWTGVGFGNFGTAYPKYQYPGAPDVKTAHNDYLQMLCETGLFGLIAFALFWGAFLWSGLKRIIREREPWDRWMLTGLYASVLAFLLHSLVDFNFVNPAVAFFVFLLAGIFCAWSSLGEPEPTPRAVHQIFVVPILLVVALAGGVGYRIVDADSMLGPQNMQDLRLNSARGLFDAISDKADPNQAPMFPVSHFRTVLLGRASIEKFGVIHVPVGGGSGGHRPLGRQERMPPNAFVIIRDPAEAQRQLLAAAKTWIAVMVSADALYPYDPDVADKLFQWYDLLIGRTTVQKEKQRLVLEALRWAEESVKRSPAQAWFRMSYGKALWHRANIEISGKALDFYGRGLEEYRIATTLYPISSQVLAQYGAALVEYGAALRRFGRNAEAAEYEQRGRGIVQRAQGNAAGR